MRIDRVRIENFCQHPERDDTFGTGVIGVMGRNGAGKSNYLKAIRRGLTGDSGNFGKKEDDLRWGTEKGHIIVDFTSAGLQGFIKRDLKTSRCQMKFGNDEYRTASEIQNVIYDILGVHPRVLTDMVFVSQGQIEGILFQKPSERAASLQILFGTGEAEKIREFLYAELTGLTVDSRMAMITELKTRINKEIEEPLAYQRVKLNSLVMYILNNELLEKTKELISRYTNQKRAIESIGALRQSVSLITTERDTAMSDLSSLLDAKDIYKKALDGSIEVKSRCIDIIERDRSYKAENDLRYTLQGIIDDSTKILNIPEPALLDPGEYKRLSTRYNELLNEISMHKKVLENVGDQNICPVCLQTIPVGHKQKHVAHLEKLQAEIMEVSARYGQAEVAWNKYKDEKQTWEVKRRVAEDNLKKAKDALASITIVTPPSSKEVEEAVVILSELNTTEELLRKVQTNVAVGHEKLKQLEIALNTAVNNLKTQDELLGASVSDKDYELAKTSLDHHNKAMVEAGECRGKIETLENRKLADVGQLTRLEDEEKNLEPIRRWKAMLERARGLLHRDQLPNVVANTYIKSISARIAKYLDIFDCNFTARILSDLNIECLFGGNKVMPAERLSGGQRVMLGTSFRFAIYDLFVSSLGLLVLDEPTLSLDDDNIEGVVQLFERVRSYSQGTGLQLIVVTHDKRLASVFDKVITL